MNPEKPERLDGACQTLPSNQRLIDTREAIYPLYLSRVL
jgi:hypothetical protein